MNHQWTVASCAKKWAGQKVAIFLQTLQSFDRIPTESCKFSTEKIMGAQQLTFSPEFLPKMKVFSPKFGIFGRAFSDEKIFDNFLTVKN